MQAPFFGGGGGGGWPLGTALRLGDLIFIFIVRAVRSTSSSDYKALKSVGASIRKGLIKYIDFAMAVVEIDFCSIDLHI